jgi:hypothetical protein
MSTRYTSSSLSGGWLAVGLFGILFMLFPGDCAIAQSQEGDYRVRTVVNPTQESELPWVPAADELTAGSLYFWSGGLLESQQPPFTGFMEVTWYVPCYRVNRWAASLAGDIGGTNYGLSGTFEFTPSAPQVVYFRIILIHKGAEQALLEYPLNLQSGYQKVTFADFPLTGLDPVAVAGDVLLMELDPRGLKGKWRIYFGGTAGAKLSIPETPISELANFSGHIIDETYPSASSVFAVDLDRNGKMDLLVGNYLKNQMLWWENTGNQNFVKHIIESSVTLRGNGTARPVAVDMDRDGDMDLLSLTDYSKVTWWENTGAQVFTRHTLSIALSGPNSAIPVDLDRDGDVDILIAGYDLGWLENDGHQQFSKRTIDSASVDAIDVVDLNKDGCWDILTVQTNGAIYWWKNSGTQVFSRQTILAPITSTSTGSAICAADVDRDGDMDVIAKPWQFDSVSWWENDGSENFSQHTIHASFDADLLRAHDMDADGDMDIVGGGSAIAWLENTGKQDFMRHTIAGGQGDISLADFDGDGDVDIASGTSTKLSWWENKNSLTPPPKAVLISPSGAISLNPPTYKWNAVPNASYYYLWVSDSADSEKIKIWYKAAEAGCTSGTGTCSATPSTTIAAGTATWWIQTWNQAGYGPWSDGMSFAVGASIPGKATLLSPSGSTQSATPTYTWNAVPSATWYYLWVNDSTTTPGKVKQWYAASEAGCGAGTGNCSVLPSTALAAGAAEWWIQTWNEAGYGPWSDGMRFTVTSAGPPGKATLIAPTGTITNSTPTYSWNAVAGSTWYLLWVNDATVSGKINTWYTAEQAGCGAASGICTIKPDIALSNGAAQWWIQTWNASGYGPWSDGMAFVVGSAGSPEMAALGSPR